MYCVTICLELALGNNYRNACSAMAALKEQCYCCHSHIGLRHKNALLRPSFMVPYLGYSGDWVKCHEAGQPSLPTCTGQKTLFLQILQLWVLYLGCNLSEERLFKGMFSILNLVSEGLPRFRKYKALNEKERQSILVVVTVLFYVGCGHRLHQPIQYIAKGILN